MKEINGVVVTTVLEGDSYALRVELSVEAREALENKLIAASGSVSQEAHEIQLGAMMREYLIKQINKGRVPAQLTLLPGTGRAIVEKDDRGELIRCLGAAWTAHIGVPSYPRIGKAIKPLREAGEPEDQILKNFVSYLEQTDPQYASPEAFANRYSAIRAGTLGNGGNRKSDWQRTIDELIGDSE